MVFRYAGVPEGDPADDALDFALQFELIKKQEAKNLTIREVDFADADSFGIPRYPSLCICGCTMVRCNLNMRNMHAFRRCG